MSLRLKIALIGLALFASPLAAQSPDLHPELRPVITALAQKLPAQSGRFVGTIEASTTVGIAFEVLGRLTSREVDEGDQVKAGDLLAKMDAQSLLENRNAARAALEGAEAQLITAQNALERAETLVKRGSESTAALESAQRNAAVARASADQARAQLARAEDGLTRSELTAPMDGIVVLTRHDAGSTVAAGDPILVLASLTGRKAKLTLPSRILDGLELGAAFTIHSPELPPEGLAGQLLRIDPVSLSETRMRQAEIALIGPSDFLAIGQLVEVRLGTTNLAQNGQSTPSAEVIAIPPEAVFEVDGQTYVWRVLSQDKARHVTRQVVQTGGPRGDGLIAVTGLSQGDEVVLRGLPSLTEGQPVGPATRLPSQSAPLPIQIEVK